VEVYIIVLTNIMKQKQICTLKHRLRATAPRWHIIDNTNVFILFLRFS